jgi:hypothetical protein
LPVAPRINCENGYFSANATVNCPKTKDWQENGGRKIVPTRDYLPATIFLPTFLYAFVLAISTWW